VAELSQLRDNLLALEDGKRRVVAEAEALLEALDAPLPDGSPGVGLNGPLIDKEGFPRADVDLFQVRAHRQRLAVLRTDRKALEERIYASLKELHAFREANPEAAVAFDERLEREERTKEVPSQPLPVVAPTVASDSEADLVPLALIDEVFENSPAAEAGIMEGDRVLCFGSLQHRAGATTLKPHLRDFATETTNNFGTEISLLVLRGEERVRLQLTPRNWSGRGALGFHLVAL